MFIVYAERLFLILRVVLCGDNRRNVTGDVFDSYRFRGVKFHVHFFVPMLSDGTILAVSSSLFPTRILYPIIARPHHQEKGVIHVHHLAIMASPTHPGNHHILRSMLRTRPAA